jgi:uncharacterized membrane protein
MARCSNDPTGDDPTGSDPAGMDPTGQDPTGNVPTGDVPTGSGPTGKGSTGKDATRLPPHGPPSNPMRSVWRAISNRPRLFTGLVVMLLVWPLLPTTLKATTRFIVAWDIGVLVFLALATHLFVTASPDDMPAAAEAQQEGEWTIFWLTLAVVVVSFVAVSSEFVAIKSGPPASRGLQVTLVSVTLLLSWLVTHVTFALRYAHEFYARALGGPDVDRGLDFPGETEPDYLDFLYFSLVLGMTFQVSDVQIISRKLRRVAALHGLISFLFNTVIVAFTVNIAAGLMG